MTKDEALDLALEALEENGRLSAMAILRTAIAEAETQEPVAWVADGVLMKIGIPEKYTGYLYTTPPAAPVQEPVAWATMLGSYAHVSWGKDRPDYPIRYEVPLYTTPQPKRQWVGLSEEEIDKLKHLIDWTATWSHGRFAYEIEQLLKEKNA
jgi:hypothetical protein